MAKREITELTDDIDGSVITGESGETISFSVSGVDYSIDLKNKNAKEFRRLLDVYVGHATRVGGRSKRSSPATKQASKSFAPSAVTKRDPEQTRAIRQWASDEGYKVSGRGRIPASVEEAYDAAH